MRTNNVHRGLTFHNDCNTPHTTEVRKDVCTDCHSPDDIGNVSIVFSTLHNNTTNTISVDLFSKLNENIFQIHRHAKNSSKMDISVICDEHRVSKGLLERPIILAYAIV